VAFIRIPTVIIPRRPALFVILRLIPLIVLAVSGATVALALLSPIRTRWIVSPVFALLKSVVSLIRHNSLS
jgi:hypothetical protein